MIFAYIVEKFGSMVVSYQPRFEIKQSLYSPDKKYIAAFATANGRGWITNDRCRCLIIRPNREKDTNQEKIEVILLSNTATIDSLRWLNSHTLMVSRKAQEKFEFPSKLKSEIELFFVTK